MIPFAEIAEIVRSHIDQFWIRVCEQGVASRINMKTFLKTRGFPEMLAK